MQVFIFVTECLMEFRATFEHIKQKIIQRIIRSFLMVFPLSSHHQPFFQFTAPACPERHLEVASILATGGERNDKFKDRPKKDAGAILADILRKFLSEVHVDDGLKSLGYSTSDIPALVKATLPQQRVTKLAPLTHTQEDLARLFEHSMKLY